jgi:DNA-binding NtrC family response regulator
MIKPTILVVDDDKKFTDIFVDFLQKNFNANVFLEKDGQGAIKVLDQRRVDILYQDVHLPNSTSGLDVVRHVKKTGKCNDILVYIISKWERNESYEMQMLDLKVEFLPKPLSLLTAKSLLEIAFEEKGGYDYKKKRG